MPDPNPTPESQFDAEIARVLKELSQANPETEEYGKLLERVSKLHKLQTEDLTTINRIHAENRGPESPVRKPLSPDTVLGVAANIFGILWLTRYEKEHVINSKALNFVLRPRS